MSLWELIERTINQVQRKLVWVFVILANGIIDLDDERVADPVLALEHLALPSRLTLQFDLLNYDIESVEIKQALAWQIRPQRYFFSLLNSE